MKIISFIFALACATAAYAKTDVGDFNRAILEGIKAETKSDSDSFRVQSRAPASVEASPIDRIENQKKSLDKMEKNYKQVGQPQW
jgi:hypothetical protein